MSSSFFCHGCRQFDNIQSLNAEEIRCNHCGSEAMELVEEDQRSSVPNRQNRPQIRFHGAISFGGQSYPLNPSQIFGSSGLEWLDRLASQLMDDYEPSARATSSKIQENLEVLCVRQSQAKGEPNRDEAFACAGDPCSICHDDFNEGEGVVELPCAHDFHKTCLLPWLKTHNTCPICRIELPEGP